MGSPTTVRNESLQAVQETAAYRGTREWVLSRKTQVGDPLDVSSLATHLDVEDHQVADALVKLRHEAFVAIVTAGTFTATPIPLERVMRLFDARAVIQLGVIDAHLPDIDAEVVEVLERIAQQLADVVAEPMPGFERFLALSRLYHVTLIGAAGSEELVKAYDQFAISALWRSALTDVDWWNRFDVHHHACLTALLRERDGAAAKEQVLEHREQVKGLVREVFIERGGTL